MCGAELHHLSITSRFCLIETQVSGSLPSSHAPIPKFHVLFKSAQKATSLKLLSRVNCIIVDFCYLAPFLVDH
jgi:hypothetical protein